MLYSRVGDAPERLLATTIDLRPDWRAWEATEPRELLRPEQPYEGIDYPVEPSRPGAAIGVRQLRDPCIFVDGDARYCYYSAAGEECIAMARLYGG